MSYRRVANIKTASELTAHLAELGLELPIDERLETGPDAPLARPVEADGLRAGNRFAILPMEGWDGDRSGRPTSLTRRRWRRFGESGAKLIWGGEAVAVRPDGRANPNQLLINADTVGDLASMRRELVDAHHTAFGSVDDLVVGLQLTHSGRFARPNDKRLEPAIAYHHPLLDPKFGVSREHSVMSDAELEQLADDFVAAAVLAERGGFQFVDVKHCHGYLGHELLSAVDRPGRFGGSLENRTRFLRIVVEGIRARAPSLRVGVRLSAFDFIPFRSDATSSTGQAERIEGAYPYAFGGDGTGTGIDLTEPIALLDILSSLGIRWLCITAGSPYYCPHIQRPALFPPSDGYLPPEDPLAGVVRQIDVVRRLKRARPDFVYVGSGYSYLQEWLPNVAQRLVNDGAVDLVGIGRLALSYPEICADVLAGRPLERKKLCRTFSDCTTGPRNGLISGCFPLDPFYRAHEHYGELVRVKRPAKRTR